MDLYAAKQFFATTNPGKQISTSFDGVCLKCVCINFTDGVPNLKHQLNYNKVKFTFEEGNNVYIPIDNHVEECSYSDIQKIYQILYSTGNVNIREEELSGIVNCEDEKEKQEKIQLLSLQSNMSLDQVNDLIKQFISLKDGV